MGILSNNMGVTGPAFVLLIFFILPAYISGKCCHTKVVAGVTYHLASTTDPVPNFCLGGCVYIKENDPKPGSNYCFKQGDELVSCRGGECSSSDGWIKQFFQEECSAKINTYLGVSVEEQPEGLEQICGEQEIVLEADVQLFDDDSCAGVVYQNITTKLSGKKAMADFFLKSESPNPWSVSVIKKGYKKDCVSIGVVKPFTENTVTVQMRRNEETRGIIPVTSIDFSFRINNELLPDVFVKGVQKNRTYFNQNCLYASWDIAPGQTNCDCRGMIRKGMKFHNTSLPNEDDQHGQGLVTGGLVSYAVGRIYPQFDFLYVDFKRRVANSNKVCESNLKVTVNSTFYKMNYTKNVPCFAAQNSPVQNISLASKEDLQKMFSEVDGALVWGGGDRFWMISCSF